MRQPWRLYGSGPLPRLGESILTNTWNHLSKQPHACWTLSSEIHTRLFYLAEATIISNRLLIHNSHARRPPCTTVTWQSPDWSQFPRQMISVWHECMAAHRRQQKKKKTQVGILNKVSISYISNRHARRAGSGPGWVDLRLSLASIRERGTGILHTEIINE